MVVGDGATPSMLEYVGEPAAPTPLAATLGAVGPDGAATYTQAIQLPPTLLAPNLALTYSSGGKRWFDVGYWG